MRDNGKGVASGKDLHDSARLGIKTILALGEDQLGGKINFDCTNGVCFSLVFDDNRLHDRFLKS